MNAFTCAAVSALILAGCGGSSKTATAAAPTVTADPVAAMCVSMTQLAEEVAQDVATATDVSDLITTVQQQMASVGALLQQQEAEITDLPTRTAVDAVIADANALASAQLFDTPPFTQLLRDFTKDSSVFHNTYCS